jgi:DNA-binding HxlR family transcriptional regulator
MLRRTYEGENCSVARALDLVGDRWPPLVIRDVGLGKRRFALKCGTNSGRNGR